MKKVLVTLLAGGLTLAVNTAVAQDDEGDSGPGVIPVELYACSYNEGMGYSELADATEVFNDWADDEDINNYDAWIMAPFYMGAEQDFDFLWLGVAPTGQAMGAIQDQWLATGQEGIEAFAEMSNCGVHAQFAAVNFKQPPEREDPNSLVMSFSDCNLSEGVSFDDIAPSITKWGEMRAEQGSSAGLWALFPAYGGGGEEFDFKFIGAWQNMADMGTDFDTYSEVADEAEAMFGDKVSCDSSRVYVASKARSSSSE